MGIHKIDHEIIEKAFCSIIYWLFCIDFGKKNATDVFVLQEF